MDGPDASGVTGTELRTGRLRRSAAKLRASHTREARRADAALGRVIAAAGPDAAVLYTATLEPPKSASSRTAARTHVAGAGLLDPRVPVTRIKRHLTGILRTRASLRPRAVQPLIPGGPLRYHPEVVTAIQSWLEKHISANYPVGSFVSVQRTDQPPQNDDYYFGAIYDNRATLPVRLVIRTHHHQGNLPAGWTWRVTDQGLPGAPRVWIDVPTHRANEQSLNELLPLLAVWGTR